MRRGALLSRSGTTSPLGKLDAHIDRVRVESVVRDKFAEKAALMGKPPGEFLRDIVRVVALGPDELKRMNAAKVDQVMGMLIGKTDK